MIARLKGDLRAELLEDKPTQSMFALGTFLFEVLLDFLRGLFYLTQVLEAVHARVVIRLCLCLETFHDLSVELVEELSAGECASLVVANLDAVVQVFAVAP